MDTNSFRALLDQVLAAYESVHGGVGAGPSPVNLPIPSRLFEKEVLSEKSVEVWTSSRQPEISAKPKLAELSVPRHLIAKAVEGSSPSTVCECGGVTGTENLFAKEVGFELEELESEGSRESEGHLIEHSTSRCTCTPDDAMPNLPSLVKLTAPLIDKEDRSGLEQQLAGGMSEAHSEWSTTGGFHAIVPNSIAEPDVALDVSGGGRTGTVRRRRASQLTSADVKWLNLVVPLIERRRRLAMRPYWAEDASFDLDCSEDRDDDEGDAVFETWTHKGRASLSPASSFQILDIRRSTCLPSCGRSLEYFVISPFSWKKSVWMLLGAVVFFLDFFMLTLTVFGLSLDSGGAIFWDYFNGIFWSFDMLLVFFTGLYIKLEVVTSLPTIARHYLSRWFLFDMCMLSIQWGLIIADMGDTKKVKWLKYVKFGKYIRLLRMAKIEGLVTKALEMVNSVHMLSLIKICGQLLLVVLYIHCMATAWYGSSVRMGGSGWAIDGDGNGLFSEFPLNYFIALHWTVAQLQGTCDIYPGHTIGERGWATVHVFTSVVVMAILFGNVAALMHQMIEMKGKKDRWVNTARHYLEDHHISKELSLRVRKYVQWLQVHNTTRDRDEDELLQSLPLALRCEVLEEESRAPLVSTHIVFIALRSTHPRSWQRLICDALVAADHKPGAFLFSYGHICESMRFVVRGEARYSTCDEFMQSVLKLGRRSVNAASRRMNIRDLVDRARLQRSLALYPGSTCCEASLWVDWVHCGDASAVDQVQVFKLRFQDFKDMMQVDPTTKTLFVGHAFRFTQVLNFFGKEKVNDLTTSDHVMELSRLIHSSGVPCLRLRRNADVV